jgi:hypothetical protein
MLPDFKRYCAECDCPELCEGAFCLRDEAGDDRGVVVPEFKQAEPIEVVNKPQFEKEKEFLTEIIS